ncbi:MAG: four helix bundle protein [Gemmatimonadales bacterium]
MPNSLEDLIVWQEGRALVKEVYQISDLGAFRLDLGLRSQIRRAVVSIPSNIAEGFERGGRREFHQFLTVAKGSCGEVRTQLLLAADLGHVPPEGLRPALERAARLSRLLGGMRKAVASQRKSRAL